MDGAEGLPPPEYLGACWGMRVLGVGHVWAWLAVVGLAGVGQWWLKGMWG